MSNRIFYIIILSSLFIAGFSFGFILRDWTDGDCPVCDKQLDEINLLAQEDDYSITTEYLCAKENYIMSPEEADYNEYIRDDPFVQHLRRSIDALADGSYEFQECEYNGYYKGKHCPDSAYNNFTGPGLFDSKAGFPKGKFIVLQTDIAPGGGESIILIFKERPDTIYYAWVYSDDDSYYDLRGFYLYEEKEDSLNLREVQDRYINQLCDEEAGI